MSLVCSKKSRWWAQWYDWNSACFFFVIPVQTTRASVVLLWLQSGFGPHPAANITYYLLLLFILVANVIYENQAGDRKGIIFLVIHAFTPICWCERKDSNIFWFDYFFVLKCVFFSILIVIYIYIWTVSGPDPLTEMYSHKNRTNK